MKFLASVYHGVVKAISWTIATTIMGVMMFFSGVVTLAVPALALYGLVQFVKWSWNN